MRLARQAVELALAEVKRCTETITSRERDIKELDRDMMKMVKTSGFTGEESQFVSLSKLRDKASAELDKARAELKEANERLDKANERLDKANEVRQEQIASMYAAIPSSKKQRNEASESDLREYIMAAEAVSLEKSGTLLDAPIPRTIFQTPLDNGLFIREEYVEVSHIIATKIAANNDVIRRVLVLGSPGIGKSVFGVFLFLLAIKEKKNVAYHPLDLEFTYFFTWNRTEERYIISYAPYESNKYEGYFDGNVNGGALKFNIFNRIFLFSSPRTTNYNEFVKERCFQVYLNPWNRQECKQFAELAVFAENDEWLRRFNLIGGKPRLLFSPTIDFDSLVQRVGKEIPLGIEGLKNQVRLFEQNVFDDRMKHLVFNFYRDAENPSCCYLAYASLVVEVIMTARYEIETADQIRLLLQTPAPNLQSWRGREIEKFLLEDLATATFCIKSLEPPNLGQVENIGPFKANSRTIQAASEIQNELMLNIPLSKTFPAIDGVLVVPNKHWIIYAQSTVSTAHPIKFTHLKDLYNQLSQRAEFQGYTHKLLFIVPNDAFDGFRAQPYKNVDANVNREKRIDIPVTQYVGKVCSNG